MASLILYANLDNIITYFIAYILMANHFLVKTRFMDPFPTRWRYLHTCIGSNFGHVPGGNTCLGFTYIWNGHRRKAKGWNQYIIYLRRTIWTDIWNKPGGTMQKSEVNKQTFRSWIGCRIRCQIGSDVRSDQMSDWITWDTWEYHFWLPRTTSCLEI